MKNCCTKIGIFSLVLVGQLVTSIWKTGNNISISFSFTMVANIFKEKTDEKERKSLEVKDFPTV